MTDEAAAGDETVTREHLALVTEVSDAAHVTADFVNGVAGLAAGVLGGERSDGRKRPGRLLSNLSIFNASRRDNVASSLAGSYGVEQLGKAAREAERAVVALDGLRPVPACRSLVAQLDELGVPSLPSALRTVDPKSAELVALNQRLAQARRVIAEATSRLTLLRLRAGDP